METRIAQDLSFGALPTNLAELDNIAFRSTHDVNAD